MSFLRIVAVVLCCGLLGNGGQAESPDLLEGTLAEDQAEQPPVENTPKTKARPRPEDRPALRTGAEVPEWDVAEWSDGKDRKLADYRGKVVVLKFWGAWNRPCVDSIPVMKALEKHYANQDVVFLAIHTAGTEMAVIQRLLNQERWRVVTAIDTGENLHTGVTADRYIVNGYPTIMVLDRNGKVHLNTGDFSRGVATIQAEMAKLAKEKQIPWPPAANLPLEEITKQFNELNVHLFSRKIDEALNKNGLENGGREEE